MQMHENKNLWSYNGSLYTKPVAQCVQRCNYRYHLCFQDSYNGKAVSIRKICASFLHTLYNNTIVKITVISWRELKLLVLYFPRGF